MLIWGFFCFKFEILESKFDKFLKIDIKVSDENGDIIEKIENDENIRFILVFFFEF